MTVSRNGVVGILIGAAVGTLFAVPAQGSAQDSLSVFACRLDVLGDLVRFCAERGTANAQILLGLTYRNGEGVPEDDAEAVRWYRLAAEQGHDGGQSNLGTMYGSGEGVPEDIVLAYMWFNLAAGRGYELAQADKARIEQRMTREQIAEAQRLSREWIEAHPPDGGN